MSNLLKKIVNEKSICLLDKIISETFINFKSTLISIKESTNIPFEVLINDKKDKNGQNLMHYAAKKGQIELFDFLLTKGGELNSEDNKSFTPIFVAIENNNLNLMKYLINEKNISANSKTKQNLYLLHCVSKFEHVKSLKYLIYKGADINIYNEINGSPLEIAINFNNVKAVKVLIDNKVDISYFSKEKVLILFNILFNHYYSFINYFNFLLLLINLLIILIINF